MAVTQTQQLPAPFLQDVTKDYAGRLGAVTAPALDTSKFAKKNNLKKTTFTQLH